MQMKFLTAVFAGLAALGALTACGRAQTPEAPPVPVQPQTVELGTETPAAPALTEKKDWRWDFTEGEARIATWEYMDADPTPHPNGVLFTVKRHEGAVAVKRGVRMEADDYGAVKVRATLEDGSPLRRVRFFWARDAEVEVRGEGWPFSEERVVNLQRNAADPALWEANLTWHPLWDGEMEGYFVEFAVPSSIDLEETGLKAILTEVTLVAAN